MKLWNNADGKPWAANVKDLQYEVLSVSQFTLYAQTSKGSKPDFHLAMKSAESRDFYASFLEKLRQGLGDGDKVKDGEFGAMMDVSLTNDGPVTIIVDSVQQRKPTST
ncbi:D-tyrosyl-tRNA(Tyr) deacylase [Blyttiomyces sp. JEL0837]|nr:D-tyrosyl-tRNA(Tyr) deacylase [Blyttiomyces sp. JEL0837]